MVSVFLAEDLPAMDSSNLVSTAGIDAYVQVDFAGNPPCKSSVVTVKGTHFLNVTFLEDLWLPVSVPTMASKINISVWDKDRTSKDDLVARVVLNWNDVIGQEATDASQRWVNLYGPPLTKSLSTKQGVLDYVPEQCSTYRGRVLLSTRRVQNPDVDTLEKPHVVEMEDAEWESHLPSTTRYVLRVMLLSGTNMPTSSRIIGTSTYFIRIAWGAHVLTFTPSVAKNGRTIWAQSKELRAVILPTDISQIPHLFLYLIRVGLDKNEVPVAYTRIKVPSLLDDPFQNPPKWYHVYPDIATTKKTQLSDLVMGSILVRIGVGREEMAAKVPWSSNFDVLREMKPHVLRVHVFQAKNCNLNERHPYPFIVAKWAGHRLQSKRGVSSHTAPLFYETLMVEDNVPTSEACFEPVRIQMWSGRRLLGQAVVNYGAMIKTATSVNSAPAPIWIQLHPRAQSVDNDVVDSLSTSSTTSTVPQLLVSIQVLQKNSTAHIIDPPSSLTPKYRTAFIEVVALGVRGVKAFHYRPIQRPFLAAQLIGGQYADKKYLVRKRRQLLPSNTPDGPNANFLQRLILPVLLPEDPRFSPQLQLTIMDSRWGGIQSPVVATTIIDLQHRMPWNDKSYVAPTAPGLENFQSDEEVRSPSFVSSDGTMEDFYPIEDDFSDGESIIVSPTKKHRSSIRDNGLGIGELELPVIRPKVGRGHNMKEDPVLHEQLKLEEARRYYAACAEARKKGTFVRMQDKSALLVLGEDSNGLNPAQLLAQDMETELEPAAYYVGRDWWIKVR